jgi:HEAT repeat protein
MNEAPAASICLATFPLSLSIDPERPSCQRPDAESLPMKKRLLFWVLCVAVALGAASLLLPASPWYLSDLAFWGGYHDGHRTAHWVKELHSPDPQIRCQAIHALGAIGPAAEESVPALTEILRRDPERWPRVEAALALSKMRPASRSAVPALGEALTDEELWVRMNAAVALSGLGRDSRPAVPALLQALKDERNRTNLEVFHFTIQEQVAVALGRASTGTPEAVPALTETLRGADSALLRQAAARALGSVGGEARPAVPLLREMLRDDDPQAQRVAREALRHIEGEPEETR